MAIEIEATPHEETFVLTDLDPTGETSVTIRQATFGEIRRRQQQFARQKFVTREGGKETVFEQDINVLDVRAGDIYLVLSGAQGIVDKKTGQPFFTFKVDADGKSVVADTLPVFKQKLDRLGLPLVTRIYECVHKVNGDFDPTPPQQTNTSEE